MIYFFVTTSLYNDSKLREKQYTIGITTLGEIVKNRELLNYKIIIIENNGKRSTFLDTLGYDVFYTNNNTLKLGDGNKGLKELKDIKDTIVKYNIDDNDLIVKMTGRYILENDSEFINTLMHLLNEDCIIKYGSYNKPANYKMEDCITGLIATKCKYVKEIRQKDKNDCLEWAWARMTYLIPDNKIHKIDKLGIYICPGSNDYFLV